VSWESKLIETIKAAASDPMMGVVFGTSAPADPSFIQHLKESKPNLDDDYLRFLSLTDGAQLWMYVLGGSGRSALPSLEILDRRWKPNTERLGVFPIGEAPDGSCIAIAENGRVVQFDYRAEQPSDIIDLASSFSTLLDDVFMGHLFYSLFDVPPEEIEDNEWTDYLRKKGWLQRTSYLT